MMLSWFNSLSVVGVLSESVVTCDMIVLEVFSKLCWRNFEPMYVISVSVATYVLWKGCLDQNI